MMKPTIRLRFVRRVAGEGVNRILQQQWIDDDPADEGAIKYEWRDVSTEDDSQHQSTLGE